MVKQYRLHSDGFVVSIAQDEIESYDEYKDDDPYRVEENLGGRFQQSRIDMTISALRRFGVPRFASARVLDLGCGKGFITELLAKEFGDWEFSAVDSSMSAISFAHSQSSSVEYYVANALETPFDDDYFDMVVCNNLWEHLRDVQGLLSEVSRVLKSDGVVFVSTPSRFRLSNIARVLTGRPVRLMSANHVTEYTVGQVAEHFAYAGFSVVSVNGAASAVRRAAKPFRYAFALWAKLVKSTHVIEPTMFVVAVKLDSSDTSVMVKGS